MENEIYSTLDGEPLPEVGNSRLAEYKAIEKEVDAEAEHLTREELGMPEDQWWFGSCHTFWKHKKRILHEKYHMRYRNRIAAFKLETGTRCAIHSTFITTYGLQKGLYSSSVQHSLTMDDLFQ